MVFPIAVGTGPRHSSSRPFPPSPRNCNGEQSSNEQVQHDNNEVIMAMGTNADGTLTATVFISYHFLPIEVRTANLEAYSSSSLSVAVGVNTSHNTSSNNNNNNNGNNDNDHSHPPTSDAMNNECSKNEHMSQNNGESDTLNNNNIMNMQSQTVQLFNVIAELRVQITPTTCPFVSNMDAMSSRETKSRVPLGSMQRRRGRLSSTSSSYATANASIEFASNETHLACLIPLPIGYQLVSTSTSSSSSSFDYNDNTPTATSTIVIFRIQVKVMSTKQQIDHKKQHRLPKLPDYIMEENEIDKERSNIKDETENDNIHVTVPATRNLDDMSDMSSHDELENESIPSRRGDTVLYVAHEPKIVRVAPQTVNDLTESNGVSSSLRPTTNQSFLRQLSSGNATKHQSSPPKLQCATCICTVPFDHYRGKSSGKGVSFVLVGTSDGTLLLVDYTTARVLSVVLKQPTLDNINLEEMKDDDNDISSHDCSSSNTIVHLSQCTPTQWKPLDIYGEEQGSISKGRIVTVLRDGSVNIYTSSFVPSSSSPAGDVKKYVEIQLRINLLSTYHASMSPLRYFCAKWINPLVLVLLTRSPYLDEEGYELAAKCLQSEIIVAQVWNVAEIVMEEKNQSEYSPPIEQINGWKYTSNVGANIALVSELKLPCGENSFDELVHETFTLTTQDYTQKTSSFSSTIFSECIRGMSISYHRGTDCLIINSHIVTAKDASLSLQVRPFGLIWDWKRNAPGLTLASSKSYSYNQQVDDANAQQNPSLYSWLQLVEDEKYGLCAIHVHGQVVSGGKLNRAKKNIFSLSALSPRSVLAAEGNYLSVAESSPILLHRDSVTFPAMSKVHTSNAQDISLQWEESTVPPSYIASNGPCQIGAIGKEYGRSIAVASSHGLCVLDLSRVSRDVKGKQTSLAKQPRWKLFSNINDEHRFRIESMCWWECGGEDFLLAVVQYTNVESLHLVCWSRKLSLGFRKSQLLEESPTAREKVGDAAAYDYGLALPPGFRIHSMSILNDPADAPSNRALLQLAYVSSQEGISSCMKYALYQLQAMQSSDGKFELVLARNAASGRIPLQLGRSPDLSATEAVTGVFLAGGSFLFDLNTGVAEEEDTDALNDTIAVIGIVTVFQDLVAVCVSQTGPTLYRPNLLEKSAIDEPGVGRRKSLIVSYCTSGTLSCKDGCRVAWTIAKNNGKVYCWSVPCRNAESSCAEQSVSC